MTFSKFVVSLIVVLSFSTVAHAKNYNIDFNFSYHPLVYQSEFWRDMKEQREWYFDISFPFKKFNAHYTLSYSYTDYTHPYTLNSVDFELKPVIDYYSLNIRKFFRDDDNKRSVSWIPYIDLGVYFADGYLTTNNPSIGDVVSDNVQGTGGLAAIGLKYRPSGWRSTIGVYARYIYGAGYSKKLDHAFDLTHYSLMITIGYK